MSKEVIKLEPCGGCYGSGWIPRDPDIGTDQECFVCGGSGACPKEPEQEPFGYVYEVLCLPECATEREWVETFTTYTPNPDFDIRNVVAVYTSSPAQRKPPTTSRISNEDIHNNWIFCCRNYYRIGCNDSRRMGACNLDFD